MPIIDMQRRVHETGRIRLGQKQATASGKTRPAKLETFRLTSGDKTQIEAAAELWGGTPAAWEDQWEVVTDATELAVVVPPSDQAFSQYYELWSGGGCQRRCDGQRDLISDKPCMCDPDPQSRDCKPTTRLNVMLPDLRGIGLWRLESHGYYAATELGGVVDLIRAAAGQGVMLPGRLRLDQRTSKRDGQTNRFVVPVLDVDAPLGQIASGGRPAAALTPVSDDAPTRREVTTATAVREVAERVEKGPNRRKGTAPAPRAQIEPRTAQEASEQVSANEVRTLAIACRKAGLSDDERHWIAGIVSGWRTVSTKELTEGEIDQAHAAVRIIEAGHAGLVDTDGATVLRKTDGTDVEFPVDVDAVNRWLNR